jgi:transcriptional regulator
MSPTVVSIQEIINKPLAVLDTDGRKVAEVVEKLYGKANQVVLSFKGLDFITTAFLNAALGSFLLRAKDPEEASKRITIADVKSDVVLRKVEEVRKLATDPAYRAAHERIRQDEIYS